ncbi:hypothetical protein VitviT2T_005089 [Vitis vinifera]|uniref:GAG-pre-integrase domain-containing protein n=1 Tax=Vitis vinifera TaxID=29760 RepID=A0ABY9BRI5_VITVI|nr:hypothetical protein VitviT2T_005089 [Vitis vinifera]
MNFVMKTGGQNSREEAKDRNVVCTNCKREGHDADTCFQLIGYPKWWGNRPRTNISGRGGGRKHGAHGGHDKGGIAQANAATTNDANKKGIVGLNDEQLATLMGMLSAHKTGTNKRLMGKQSQLPYIIDSGASNHMTSVYTCMREDRSTRKVIGAGEQCEGLYFLKGATSVHAFKMNGVASFELWHRRMGHPSSKVLGLIPEVDVTTDDLNVYRTHNWSAGIEVDCDEGELTNVDVSAKEGNLEDDVVE